MGGVGFNYRNDSNNTRQKFEIWKKKNTYRKSTVIFASLVRVWASRDTTF